MDSAYMSDAMFQVGRGNGVLTWLVFVNRIHWGRLLLRQKILKLVHMMSYIPINFPWCCSFKRRDATEEKECGNKDEGQGFL
jgi:hypothetical protein